MFKIKRDLLVLLLVLAMACVSSGYAQISAKNYTIEGNITGLKDSYVYIKDWRGGSIHIDSAGANNNNFVFTGFTTEPYYAQIYTNSRKEGFGLYVQDGQIIIKGNIDSLNKAKIIGSSTQSEWEAFNLSLKDLYDKQSSAEKSRTEAEAKNDTAAVRELNTQTYNLYWQIIGRHKAYIVDHPMSFLNIDLLMYIKKRLSYEELNQLYNGLDISIRNTNTAKNFYERFIATKNKTAIGKPAIMFTQNDVNGKPFDLASYKGKYVLIDFWASWCVPCRQENPNLVKAFNEFKSKGFTIVGVSLDDSKHYWKRAIINDKLAWEQVSSLNRWENEAAKQYSVTLIPSNYLIGPDGTIIGHDLFGDALLLKLGELIK